MTFATAIKGLREIEAGTHKTRFGLCAYLQTHHGMRKRTIEPLFKTWEEFSGDLEFPIPSFEKGVTPEEKYMDTANLYENKYGRARRRLAGHIANELEITP